MWSRSILFDLCLYLLTYLSPFSFVCTFFLLYQYLYNFPDSFYLTLKAVSFSSVSICSLYLSSSFLVSICPPSFSLFPSVYICSSFSFHSLSLFVPIIISSSSLVSHLLLLSICPYRLSFFYSLLFTPISLLFSFLSPGLSCLHLLFASSSLLSIPLLFALLLSFPSLYLTPSLSPFPFPLLPLTSFDSVSFYFAFLSHMSLLAPYPALLLILSLSLTVSICSPLSLSLSLFAPLSLSICSSLSLSLSLFGPLSLSLSLSLFAPLSLSHCLYLLLSLSHCLYLLLSLTVSICSSLSLSHRLYLFPLSLSPSLFAPLSRTISICSLFLSHRLYLHVSLSPVSICSSPPSLFAPLSLSLSPSTYLKEHSQGIIHELYSPYTISPLACWMLLLAFYYSH